MAASKDSGQMVDGKALAERGLNKPNTPQQITGTIRRAQMASVEFTTDFVEAVANGWKSFRDELNQSTQLLDGKLVRGSVEAAATFLEGIAKATRRSYDVYQYATPATPAPAGELDYEKLAKLVAANLQATSKS